MVMWYGMGKKQSLLHFYEGVRAMPDHTFTLYDNATGFDYNGQRINPGDSYGPVDACEMKRFLAAFRGANPNSGIDEATENWLQTLEDECPETANPVIPQPAPVTPPSDVNPNTAGGDSAALQGAPAPPTSGRVGGTPEDDGTASASGSTDEPDRPPDGEPHPTHGGERPQVRTGAGDPVDLFNGAFYLEINDLQIPNTIMLLGFTRFYRSGAAAYSPLGWNWDHNHNLYLRQLETGNIALWRNLHEDVYTFDGADYESPKGKFEKLERVAGLVQVFEITGAGGTVMRFERPGGWIDAQRIPLLWVRDRHGNRLTYFYGADDNLTKVADEDGRFLLFEHDECGLLNKVADHAGRAYEYCYNHAAEHLVCVSTPATADHPEGIVRIYHYEQEFTLPELRHNILRVEDSQGNVYLENKYAQDPASWNYARLTEQLYGGCLFQFRYIQLQWVPANCVYVNIPAARVEVLNPDYGLETYTFNYRGDLVDRRYRLNKDKSYRVVVWKYSFDEQGNPTIKTRPDGSQEINTYDFSNPDPCMRGNLLQKEVTAAAGFPSPGRIIWRASYEPMYQLMTEETDETGTVVKYKYDFNLNPGAPGNSGKLRQIIYPDATLPDGTSQRAIKQFEYNNKGQFTALLEADGVRHEMVYGTAGREKYRLIKQVYDAGVTSIENVINYDAAGYRIKTVDGNGNTTQYAINALGQIEKIILPPVNGTSSEYRLHYDGDKKVSALERPRGTYTDNVLAGSHIIDQFQRDVLGYPTIYRLSMNTAEQRELRVCNDFRGMPLETLNPDQSRIKRVYDERGMLITEEVIGKDDVQIAARFVHDRTGNLVQETNSFGQTTQYTYDGFSRIIKIIRPNGTELRYKWLENDLMESEETIGDDGTGAIRQLAFKSFIYDEKGRCRIERLKSFEDNPAVATDIKTSFYYDLRDRLVKIVDNLGGQRVIEYDGLDRVRKQIDPVGNEQRLTYDGNGNITCIENHHVEPNGSVSIISKRFSYDTRNRRTGEIEPDGARFTFEYDDRDMAVKRTDRLGIVHETQYNSFGNKIKEMQDVEGLNIVHTWTLDDMSRVTAYSDPTGQVSKYSIDSLGRVYKTEYPNGFSSTRHFNDKGQVIKEVLGSGVKFEFAYDTANRLIRINNSTSPAPVNALPSHQFTYDGLDRMVSAQAGTHQVLRKYDSLNRLLAETTAGKLIGCKYDDAGGVIEKTWPDGRTEKYEHDLNGMLTQIEEIAAGGLGDGVGVIASIKPSGDKYFGEGVYRGGLKIINKYDLRKRLVEIRVSSPTGMDEKIKYRYDTANRKRVEAISGQNDKLTLFDFDHKYRVTAAKDGFVSAVPDAVTQSEHDAAISTVQIASSSATHQEGFEYNNADDRLKYNKTGSPDKNYTYATGHRIQSDGINAYAHHTDGTLKSDGVFSYETDALGRVITIKSGSNTLYRIEYDALGRPAVLEENGKPIRSFNYWGKDVVQENDNDDTARQITIHPATGVPVAYHCAACTNYTLFDARYNLLGLTDISGNLVEIYRYNSFGLPQIFTNTGVQIPFSAFGADPVFGGQRFLPASGLYLAKYRLMNPVNGLFLSIDPCGYADSPALYVYVGQNPVDLIDPDGDLAFLAGLLIAAAVGAVVSGGLNAVRQGVAIAEGSQERWEWGQFGISLGIGAVAGPLLVVAPELAVPLAIYGVSNGIAGIAEGNYATGAFDIVTSVAPFGFKGVRSSAFGRGTRFGQMRGLGESTSWGTRLNRFNLIGNAAGNYIPRPFGKRIGVGFSRSVRPGQTAEGHAATVVENAEGGLVFSEKNAARAPEGLVASFNRHQGLPEFYFPDPKFGARPFEYSLLRISGRRAVRALDYANGRLTQNGIEPFDFQCQNCSHFTADVLGEAGFNNFGTGRGSGVYNNFLNFTRARAMGNAAPFFTSSIHPNETVSSK